MTDHEGDWVIIRVKPVLCDLKANIEIWWPYKIGGLWI